MKNCIINGSLVPPECTVIFWIWNLVTSKAFRDQNSRPVVSSDVHEELNFIQLEARGDKVYLYLANHSMLFAYASWPCYENCKSELQTRDTLTENL